MTVNPHITDQLLAAFDELNAHADCNAACLAEGAARKLALHLIACLPDVDPKLIGEIAMHVGNVVNATILDVRRTGGTWQEAAATAVTSSLEGGVLLYRGQLDGTQ